MAETSRTEDSSTPFSTPSTRVARPDSPLSCEIQVRTLFEEIWGEIDHQLNYPRRQSEHGESGMGDDAFPAKLRQVFPTTEGGVVKKLIGSAGYIIAFAIAFWAARDGVRYFRAADAQTSPTAPGLSSGYRDGFVGGAVRTCVQTQTAAPENASIPKALLTSYCVCFANGMADRISDSDLKSAEGIPAADRIKRMQPVINAVAPVCAKELETALQK
ncbi:hypothetical protein [Bradyrhizobium sp. SZCCHNPS1003]|uniref:hypothetical protein n=1 Tax=Bradyrhizobium sp. SZCCHNPS1003 TaxID=3057330 RepID=UPI0028E532A6|nr:hypothetical protein [Bradyrhizobium sp. SZCCHNPS1003]